MYGYVRPHKPDLRIRDFQLYQAIYCGLCHALKRNYGFLARFSVSYDMCLPALMFLKDTSKSTHKRCPASPFKKKCILCNDPMLDACATLTIILAYYKLMDDIADSGFVKRTAARFLLLFLKPKYKKASKLMPWFDDIARENLSSLATAESAYHSNEPNAAALDGCAVYFANIIAAFSELSTSTFEQRVTKELFFHTGRIVYILDAADDYEEDRKSSGFNAVAIRYGLDAETLPEEIKAELFETIEDSLSAASAAFELLDERPSAPILSNILYLGMMHVSQEVLYGEKKRKRKRL